MCNHGGLLCTRLARQGLGQEAPKCENFKRTARVSEKKQACLKKTSASQTYTDVLKKTKRVIQ
jgi:hypothetical protein